MTGICKGCGEAKKLTKHHIMPRRLKLNDERCIWLCRGCHDILEGLIAKFERIILLKHRYIYHKVISPFH